MKVSKQLVAVIAALMMAMGVLAACGSSGTSSAASSAGSASSSSSEASSAAATTSDEDLSIVYLNKQGYEDLIVGAAEDMYTDALPNIELYTVSGSGSDSVADMLAGSADIAATGPGPVADAIKEHGDDIVILACINNSTGGQVWVAGAEMTGDKELTPYDKAKDNKAEVKASFETAAAALGGTIRCGVQQGATTESEFKAWLKAMDVSFNDFGTEGDGLVTLVDLKANTLPTALASSGDIDMMAASQPYPGTALNEIPGAYAVGNNADIDSYGGEYLITTKDIYAEKEDAIKVFLAADKEVVDWIIANTDEAIDICSENMGAEESIVQAAFDISEFKVDLDDLAVDTMYKTCQKKKLEITKSELVEMMPLKAWLNSDMTD